MSTRLWRHSRRYERQSNTSDLSNQVSNEKRQFRLRGRIYSFPAAPKRPQTTEGFSSLRNRIAYLETRRAKAKKPLCVLKEHVSKSSCPVGLQYRPRTHLRPDQNFNTDLRKICERMSVVLPTSRFAYKSIRLHRGRFAYTTKSIRLHGLSRFAYIKVVSPTLINRNIL